MEKVLEALSAFTALPGLRASTCGTAAFPCSLLLLHSGELSLTASEGYPQPGKKP